MYTNKQTDEIVLISMVGLQKKELKEIKHKLKIIQGIMLKC